MGKTLKVGEKVLWSGSWGSAPEEIAVVRTIEINCQGKYGVRVNEADWDQVRNGNTVVDFAGNNKHWAYGYQIRPIEDLMHVDTLSEGGN